MEELAKFTIGNKAVVGFVSQAGTVGGQLVVLSKSMNKFIVYRFFVAFKHYFGWNVDNALLASWVKDLVGVGLILPSVGTVLLSPAPHPVVER